MNEQEIGKMPNLKLAAQALEQALAEQEYGATISFDELNEMAGLDVRQNRSVLEAVKRSLMRHHGRLLVNLRGLGYQIAQQNQYRTVAGSYRRSAVKRLKKGVKILGVCDVTALSEADRKLHVEEAGKCQTLKVMFDIASKDKYSKNIDWERPISDAALYRALQARRAELEAKPQTGPKDQKQK